MFGKNPVEKQSKGDGTSLQVVEGSPFLTIQGEGPYSGRPAIFIRLHGCPLRCFFCDTNFSDPTDPWMDVEVIIDKTIDAWDAPTRHMASPWRRGPLAVITGGEPTRQPLGPLVHKLLHNGFAVQIETAGIFWQDWMERAFVHVVVSPKTPQIDAQVAAIARAFKYVIGPDTVLDEEDGLPLSSTQAEGEVARLARPPARSVRGSMTPIYLTPMDLYDEPRSRESYKRVGEIALKYGYIAQLQAHKFMSLP